jgi:hypothetical protein
MYLKTPLNRFEYMKMLLSLFPQDIIDHYRLNNKVLNGYVYMEICKGMYGLPQAGILVNKHLKKCLAIHGYYEQPHTPSLFKHKSHPVWLNLAVEYFSIKYNGENNLQHLYNALRTESYDIIEDQVGNLYCGINLSWHYEKGYVDLSMPSMSLSNLPVMLILLLSNHSIVPFPPILLHTARTIKQQHLQMTVHSSTTPARSKYNKLSAASYTMHKPSTQLSLWPSLPLPHNRLHPQRTPRNKSTSSSTTCGHIPMLRFATVPPI